MLLLGFHSNVAMQASQCQYQHPGVQPYEQAATVSKIDSDNDAIYNSDDKNQ